MTNDKVPLRKFGRGSRSQNLILVFLSIFGLIIGYVAGFLLAPPTIPEEISEKANHSESLNKKNHQRFYKTPYTPERVNSSIPILSESSSSPSVNAAPRVYEEELSDEIVVMMEHLQTQKNNMTAALTSPEQKSSSYQVLGSSSYTVASPQKPALAMNRDTRDGQYIRRAPSRDPAIKSNESSDKKIRDKRPLIAIVIDDLGVDQKRTRQTILMKPPLSLSFLTYANGLQNQANKAQKRGHEIWMHVPMEPKSVNIDPGPNVLLTGVPASERLASLRWNLDQMTGYVGINNHMGSRFTANLVGMRQVMAELKARKLAFLDSVTSSRSVATLVAREAAVPFALRNIFIDHEDDQTSINRQLSRLEKLARGQGYAIAIGHPREKTLRTLKPWLKEIEKKGFQLVPVSTLLRKTDG